MLKTHVLFVALIFFGVVSASAQDVDFSAPSASFLVRYEQGEISGRCFAGNPDRKNPTQVIILLKASLDMFWRVPPKSLENGSCSIAIDGRPIGSDLDWNIEPTCKIVTLKDGRGQAALSYTHLGSRDLFDMVGQVMRQWAVGKSLDVRDGSGNQRRLALEGNWQAMRELHECWQKAAYESDDDRLALWPGGFCEDLFFPGTQGRSDCEAKRKKDSAEFAKRFKEGFEDPEFIKRLNELSKKNAHRNTPEELMKRFRRFTGVDE